MSSCTVTVSADVLAAELEFAIAYTRACNPDRDLLGVDRKLFAKAIIAMLRERAAAGVPGMKVTQAENAGDQPGTSS